MDFITWIKKPEIAFRFKSICLQLASPVDIKSWCFQRDSNGKPMFGKITTAKTINYKTLKPELGGLFCEKVFGPETVTKNRRSNLGYIDLVTPLAHIWYLKGSPSYISLLLNKKRRMVQSVVYAQTYLTFSQQTFHSDLASKRLTLRNTYYLWISSKACFNVGQQVIFVNPWFQKRFTNHLFFDNLFTIGFNGFNCQTKQILRPSHSSFISRIKPAAILFPMSYDWFSFLRKSDLFLKHTQTVSGLKSSSASLSIINLWDDLPILFWDLFLKKTHSKKKVFQICPNISTFFFRLNNNRLSFSSHSQPSPPHLQVVDKSFDRLVENRIQWNRLSPALNAFSDQWPKNKIHKLLNFKRQENPYTFVLQKKTMAQLFIQTNQKQKPVFSFFLENHYGLNGFDLQMFFCFVYFHRYFATYFSLDQRLIFHLKTKDANWSTRSIREASQSRLKRVFISILNQTFLIPNDLNDYDDKFTLSNRYKQGGASFAITNQYPYHPPLLNIKINKTKSAKAQNHFLKMLQFCFIYPQISLIKCNNGSFNRGSSTLSLWMKKLIKKWQTEIKTTFHGSLKKKKDLIHPFSDKDSNPFIYHCFSLLMFQLYKPSNGMEKTQQIKLKSRFSKKGVNKTLFFFSNFRKIYSDRGTVGEKKRDLLLFYQKNERKIKKQIHLGKCPWHWIIERLVWFPMDERLFARNLQEKEKLFKKEGYGLSKKLTKIKLKQLYKTFDPLAFKPISKKRSQKLIQKHFWVQKRFLNQWVHFKRYSGLLQYSSTQKAFSLSYIPLSCRYALLPKNFTMQTGFQDLKEPSYSVFQPYGKTGLRNPLGHKHFRQFVLKTFNASIRKVVLLAHCKAITQRICVEKTNQMRQLSCSLNNQRMFRKNSKQTKKQLQSFVKQKNLFKEFVKFEKNKLIYLMFRQFFINSQKQMIESQWWLRLCQYACVFLFPFLTKKNFLKLKNFEKDPSFQPFVRGFVEKKDSNFVWFQTTLPGLRFNHLLFLNDYTSKMEETSLNVFLTKWDLDFNQKWLKESYFYHYVFNKKRLLNKEISKICHKINVFLRIFKECLTIQPGEIQGSLDMIKALNNHLGQKIGKQKAMDILKEKIRLRQLFNRPNLWLHHFGISVDQPFLNFLKRISNYFSIETKLVKARTVRLLLAYRLFTHCTFEQVHLQNLTWVCGLKKSKSVWFFSQFEKVLHSRLALKKQRSLIVSQKRKVHQFYSFLKGRREFDRNNYYLVGQSFSWPTSSDYLSLLKFINPRPKPMDWILPAYVERCITFDSPRTGAWGIQILLKKLKQKPILTTLWNPKIDQTWVQKPVIQHYFNFLYNRLKKLNQLIISYKTFHNVIQVYRLSPTKKELFRSINGSNALFGETKDVFETMLIFYTRLLSRLQEQQIHMTRRLKLIRPFVSHTNDPSWLILTVLPVLPPDIRPILKLEEGQFAMSDLNKLYQKVIYRNLRLKDFFYSNYIWGYENPFLGFRKVLRFHYRLAQQALDGLLDNGRSDSITLMNNRQQPLKSLSEVLRGKQGRFRQNLLGKRVDYSGRSVIIVGPELKVYQCGLPKEMALELFQPFLIRYLIHQKKIPNAIVAKRLIRSKSSMIWQCLEKIMQDQPILLNRAPTLHRLGIQAFQPLLVSGKAILLHPLVCNAFNADFDGDQMAVHVPLSYDACSEAWKLMWSRNNLFSPATGDPILMPTQDMVLGCYYLSTWDTLKQKRGLQQLKGQRKPFLNRFDTCEKLLQCFYLQQIQLHQKVWLKWSLDFECHITYQPCLEFQLDRKGNQSIFRPDYQLFLYYETKMETIWIKTTPGRVFLNHLIFQMNSI